MRKPNTTYSLGILTGACLLLSGCASIGNAPPGASIGEIQSKFNAKPIEERVKEINQMSIPEGIKQQTIKKLYAQEGKTPPAEPAGQAGSKAPVTSH